MQTDPKFISLAKLWALMRFIFHKCTYTNMSRALCKKIIWIETLQKALNGASLSFSTIIFRHLYTTLFNHPFTRCMDASMHLYTVEIKTFYWTCFMIHSTKICVKDENCTSTYIKCIIFIFFLRVSVYKPLL